MYKCRYFFSSDEQIAKYKRAYPGVPIEVELAKMEIWLDDNPKRRKKNYPKFINSWLGRATDNLPPEQAVTRPRIDTNADYNKQQKALEGVRLATPEEISKALKPLHDKGMI